MPPPSTYVDERTAIANVLDGLSGVLILWPDTEDDPPEPGSDPASPVRYIVAEIEYDDVKLVDMAGGQQIDGRLVLHSWVEKNAGDDLLRSTIDTITTLFAAGDDTTIPIYFFPPLPGPPLVGGASGEWYGRRLDIFFVRFR